MTYMIIFLNGIINCRDGDVEKIRFLPMPDDVSVSSILKMVKSNIKYYRGN